MTSEWLFTALILVVALERVYELRLSKRNATHALAQGGIERGQRHFRWMKLLHSSFFVMCLAEVWLWDAIFSPLLGGAMLGLVIVAQALRYWAISTLGPRWNVRVIAQPETPVETGGPYRWLKHPNYLAVIVEGFALPLVHGAVLTAVVFSLLNAALLRVRIRCEEQLLSELGEYQRAFRGTASFHPKPGRLRPNS